MDIVTDKKPVLVDFYATWCGPCKAMTPILKEVADKIKGSARIIKIDVDKNPSLAQEFKVKGVPTLMLFVNGKVVWRESGVVDWHQIVAILKNHL